MVNPQTGSALRTAFYAGSGFFKLLKYSLFGFFIIFLLVNAIIISIEEKSPLPAIKDIGGRLIFITYEIQENALAIYENQGIYTDTGNTFYGLKY